MARPLKFKTVEELQEKIKNYFIRCKEDKTPLTITGLALELDTTRQTLMDYEDKDEFTDTVKKAKLSIEHSYEMHLYSQNVTGPIFALKNFGWKDKSEQTTNNTTTIKIDPSTKSDAELDKRIAELLNKTGEGRTTADLGGEEA